VEKQQSTSNGRCDEAGKGGKAMAIMIKVAGDKEGEGDKEGDGIGDEGGVQQREQWLWWQEQWRQGWQQLTSNGSM
jgi:hypothetical protein